MRFKFQLLALVFMSLFSCEIAEEPIENPIAENPLVEDEKKPELTVIGFADVIETNTDISISIVDESTVETKVMRDGEELAVSSEKQFNLSINPYGLPVGLTDFMVVSKDAKGNEISETYSVEIKHLLMTYAFGSQESENAPPRWLFFNDLDGKELAVVALEEAGDVKVYTDEIVLEDRVLYSVANYNGATYTNGSFKSLHLVTYKIPLAETRPIGFYNNFVEMENTVDVTLNGVPFVDGSPDYYAWGRNYTTSSYSGDNQQTILNVKHDASGPIYIRTNRWGGSTPKFDGKKENFRYLVFTPETGNTSVVLEANQLVPAENTIKLEMPEHEPGTLFISRMGYEKAEDLAAFEGFSIYDKDSSNETQMSDYVDLPVFPTLNFYSTNLSYTKNGHRYSANGLDNSLDVVMPNWATSVVVDDSNIEVTANNQDVDYYSVRLNKTEYENNDSRSLHWILNVFEEDGSDKSMPRLALPMMISEAIEEPFFQTSSDMELYQLTAFDYGKIDSYDELVDWQVFQKSELGGDEYKYRQLSYPIPSNSNKTDVSNNLPWNLDDLFRFGLDAKGQVNRR